MPSDASAYLQCPSDDLSFASSTDNPAATNDSCAVNLFPFATLFSSNDHDMSSEKYANHVQEQVMKKTEELEKQRIHFALCNDPGTVQLREALKRYSSDKEKYPKWSDDISTLVRAYLAEEVGIDEFLVYRFNDGVKSNKRRKLTGGAWQAATDKEIFERIKQRFLDDRKQMAKAKAAAPPPPTGAASGHTHNHSHIPNCPIHAQPSQHMPTSDASVISDMQRRITELEPATKMITQSPVDHHLWRLHEAASTFCTVMTQIMNESEQVLPPEWESVAASTLDKLTLATKLIQSRMPSMSAGAQQAATNNFMEEDIFGSGGTITQLF